MEPNPKNPIIASFFRNIRWSDRLEIYLNIRNFINDKNQIS